MRTIVSPSGRMIAPRLRASSVTRWPRRSDGSCSPRSIPTMKPRARTSATSGISSTSASSSPSSADLRLQALERPLLLEGVEVGQRRGAGERVAGVGVAVEEGALLLGRAEEALVDPLGRQGRGQRHVAAGQPLGEAEEVRRDPLLLAGEHRPGAAEAGRHLVADQQHAEGGRRARAPRAGSRAGGPACRRRPGPAARRSPRRSPPRAGRGPARGRPRRPARRRGSGRGAAGRWRGRGRCRRPRPSRACRRGRRRAGGRRRCAARAGRRAAAGTGRPSSARSRSRSSRSPSRRRA